MAYPSDPVSRAYILADLASGLNPTVGQQPDDLTVAPGVGSDGVDVSLSTFAVVDVSVRENPFHRTARVVFGLADVDLSGGEVVSVTVNGRTIAAAGPFADLPTLVADLVAAAEADGTFSGFVEAAGEDLDGDGLLDTFTLTGTSEADFSVGHTVAGSSVTTLRADAKALDVRIYGRPVDSGSFLPAGKPDHLYRRRGWKLLHASPSEPAVFPSIGSDGLLLPFLAVGPLAEVRPYVSAVEGVEGDGSEVVADYAVTVRACLPVGAVVS